MLDKIRNLASDTMIYGIFTIIGRFLTFLLTPFYTNFLPQTEVGDIINVFTYIAFINIIYSFGLESSYMRFFNKEKPEHSAKVFSHAILSIIVLSGLLSTVFYLTAPYYSSFLADSDKALTIVRVACFIPLFDAVMLIPFAYLRMVRKPVKFSLYKFLLIVIAVVLNIYFVIFLELGATGVFAAQLAASVFGSVLFLPSIIKKIKLYFDRILFLDMLKFGLPTLPANLSAMALQVADRPILKALTNSDTAAIYGVNYRLAIPMMLFVTIYEYAWKPFYLSHFRAEGAKKLFARIMTYFTLITFLIFLFVSFFLEYIVKIPFPGGYLIEPLYWEGLGIVPIILGGYFFNGLYYNFAAGFHITKKTQYLPLTVGIAAIVNISLNFLLIPYIGYWGSAWATLLAYFVSSMVLYVYLQKVYPVKYEWKRIAIIVITGLIIFFIVQYYAAELDTYLSVTVKISAIILFAGLLKTFGFFTSGELKTLKKMLIRNK